jgi:hypothetical protein
VKGAGCPRGVWQLPVQDGRLCTWWPSHPAQGVMCEDECA